MFFYRITRLFCGNLNKKVTEDDLKGCIEGITYIKWITDKQTGEFYGSSFIEVASAEYAIKAVAKDKSKFMGRPLKIYYCPPRPGDIWPPPPGSQGGATSSHRNPPKKEKTPRPPGCKKLFAGNLSYNIDDDTMVEFFKDCGDMVGLRWLVHQDSGEFRVSLIILYRFHFANGYSILGIWLRGVQQTRRSRRSDEVRW